MDRRIVLLKLHYLGLEIHQIHQIYHKLKTHSHWSISTLKNCLGPSYKTYLKLDENNILRDLKRYKIGFLTINDVIYPDILRHIYMPPLVLFYKGNVELLKSQTMAVIGSRIHTSYGERACNYFVKELVKHGYVIVSGLARGIDGISHRAAIRNSGKTIAVLGSGLLRIYPPEHKKLADVIARNHLLLSEYPPFEPPQKTHFPFRNRIVSGLSEGIVVIEAAKRSGTLITCDFALDQGKDVYAVPGPIFSKKSQGTNELIQQGAKLIQGIEDILE